MLIYSQESKDNPLLLGILQKMGVPFVEAQTNRVKNLLGKNLPLT